MSGTGERGSEMQQDERTGVRKSVGQTLGKEGRLRMVSLELWGELRSDSDVGDGGEKLASVAVVLLAAS